MTDLQREARIGTTVVNRIFDLNGEVYRTDAGGVHVFIKNGEKASWPWAQVLIRHPRLESKYPRPIKHPRLEVNAVCHCSKGTVYARVRRFDPVRGKIAQIIIYCKVCRKRIGTESYPNKIKQASALYHRRLEEIQTKDSRFSRKEKRRYGLVGHSNSRRKANRRSKTKRRKVQRGLDGKFSRRT